jgi:hypothetical protein
MISKWLLFHQFLPKSGCKTHCNNYRPISVLSAVAKILESLITKQLETYLEENGVITEHQAGFRKSGI